MIGAKTNRTLWALEGKSVSFRKSFKPSAKGCNKPYRPTTFGPFRRCIDAITFRSNSVRYATETSRGTTSNNVLAILIKTKPKS